jgi:hypothetical protein
LFSLVLLADVGCLLCYWRHCCFSVYTAGRPHFSQCSRLVPVIYVVIITAVDLIVMVVIVVVFTIATDTMDVALVITIATVRCVHRHRSLLVQLSS